jgi:tRNA A37 threonylcarbamoyladenosine dehydratase
MLAYFAGAGQLASFTTDALAREGIEIITIIASSLYQRNKEIKAKLRLRLFDQVAGAFRQILAYIAI